jgi:hypothetical protein
MTIRTTLSLFVFVGLLQAGVAPAAFAEGICGLNTVIVPDGRITQSTIPANTTFWYTVSPANPGRSYSAEFRSVIDRPPTAAFALLVTTDCTGNPYPDVRNTNAIDPGVQGGGGQRRSIVITAQHPVVMFAVTNPNAVAMSYTFSVAETTMFSISVRDAQYGPDRDGKTGLMTSNTGCQFFFINTTNATITGTLTILRRGGEDITRQVILAPGAPVYDSNGDDNLSSFLSPGIIKFTHNGPPGAVLVDAAVYTSQYNVSGSTQTFIGSFARTLKFEAPREGR